MLKNDAKISIVLYFQIKSSFGVEFLQCIFIWFNTIGPENAYLSSLIRLINPKFSYKVYYPVRHHLIQHMVTSIQRLGFVPNASTEHRKIAVDLTEVILRWELQRIREEQDQGGAPEPAAATVLSSSSSEGIGMGYPRGTKMGTSIGLAASASGGQAKPSSSTLESTKPVEKVHVDAVVNFLLRLACHVNESGSNFGGSPGELLSRRCVTLLKTALKTEIWPGAELRLAWFDKLLLTVETQAPNYGNICTALELLCFLLTILRKDAILISFKPLQKGIAACMNCNNNKVIRCVHNLLSRLMSQFPAEPTTSSVSSKYEELESLYSSVSKVIHEGLSKYEKDLSAPIPPLFGTFMILKAACVNNPCYIDRLIIPFMRVLQRMARDHLNASAMGSGEPPNAMCTELLILSLDLVKNRIGVMGQEWRKLFFQTILVGLIEKSPDVKVLKAITKMLEDWVKNKGPFGANQAPTAREKTGLLVRMMIHVEKRFPNGEELNGQFLELVNYVFREETLKSSDLSTKLEQAFMAGLRCTQPSIRAKFFEVFDGSIRREAPRPDHVHRLQPELGDHRGPLLDQTVSGAPPGLRFPVDGIVLGELRPRPAIADGGFGPGGGPRKGFLQQHGAAGD